MHTRHYKKKNSDVKCLHQTPMGVKDFLDGLFLSCFQAWDHFIFKAKCSIESNILSLGGFNVIWRFVFLCSVIENGEFVDGN